MSLQVGLRDIGARGAADWSQASVVAQEVGPCPATALAEECECGNCAGRERERGGEGRLPAPRLTRRRHACVFQVAVKILRMCARALCLSSRVSCLPHRLRASSQIIAIEADQVTIVYPHFVNAMTQVIGGASLLILEGGEGNPL